MTSYDGCGSCCFPNEAASVDKRVSDHSGSLYEIRTRGEYAYF